MVRNNKDELYFLVRADILPTAIVKTIEVKKMLSANDSLTVNEAVNRVGLSRSAFYKYKDRIFPFNEMLKEKIITISLDLEHRSGLLSKLLSEVAKSGGNVLTINQTIPLQEVANIMMSVDTTNMTDSVTSFLDTLKNMEGVKRVQVVGRS